MDALDHGKLVLGAIFAYQSRQALDHAIARLSDDSFTDEVQRNLFVLAERAVDQYHLVLTRDMLADAMRDSAPGTALMYAECYDSLVAAAPPPGEDGWGLFLHSVDQLRELAAERETGDALSTGMQILRQGWRDGRTEYYGHVQSREWLSIRLSEIERGLLQAEAPEGLMNNEGQEILDAYWRRKQAQLTGTLDSVGTGIPELDRILGSGLERGELDLLVGNTSSGKTSLAVQLAWHAAVMQGKHVIYLTSETLRPQVRIKILCRHSRLDKFGLQHGINSREVKSGQLTQEAERAFMAVVADFTQQQGGVYVAQVPKHSTVESLSSRLERITRSRIADLVIIDSLQLLKSGISRRAQWEESMVMVKDAKQLAVGYRHGTGVPVVSPWQVSKEAARAAAERGFYIKGDLAETKEAENSSDILVSILEPANYTGGRHVRLTMNVLKNRDGETALGKDNQLVIDADYATSTFAAQVSGAGADVLSFGESPFGADAAWGAA